jgi:hybrid cluster-associated redox disulfide protein
MMTGLLNEAIAGGQGPAAGAVTAAPRPIVSSDVIGDILARFPATERVFRKYYGAACFSCPGQATETIRQSAMMHDADEEELLRELNKAAEGTT